MFSTFRILACAVALVSVGGRLHAQEWRFDPDARVAGQVPAMVTVTVSRLAGATDVAHRGASSVVSRFRYGERGELVEWLYFEDGRPVEYTRCSYDDALRLVSRLTRTAVSESTSTFSYEPGFSIEIVQPGAGAPVSWTQRETLRGKNAQAVYWVRTFEPDGTLIRASRTEKDSRGRDVETILYGADGSVDTLHTFQYTSTMSREVVYDKRTNRAAVSALGNRTGRTVYEIQAAPGDRTAEPLTRWSER